MWNKLEFLFSNENWWWYELEINSRCLFLMVFLCYGQGHCDFMFMVKVFTYLSFQRGMLHNNVY